jgi:hypothetical protein
MTTTDGQHDRTGGPSGVAPKQTVPAYGFLSSGWCLIRAGALGSANASTIMLQEENWKQNATVEQKT